MTPLLFAPLQLRNIEVRNRLWVPPMCQYSVDNRDGIATDWHLVHLGALARGGSGAVIVEATAVTAEGRISDKDLGLWNEAQQDGLSRIANFMAAQGATPGIQLAHAGRKASTWPAWGIDRRGSMTSDDGGWETVAPSPNPYPGLTAPRQLDRAEIATITQSFADSARRAADAGFEIIEIHAAHGYLLHEFLSPLSNNRGDEYGGSAANRARFLIEVVDAVRAEIGPDLALLVRVSATDWDQKGLTVDDTVVFAGWLKTHGVDLIDVSSGANIPAQIPTRPGYQVPFAAQIKNQAQVPTAAVGLITEAAQAEQILTTQQSDVVMVGREMLRDPHFPIRAAQQLRYQLPYLPAAYGRAYR